MDEKEKKRIGRFVEQLSELAEKADEKLSRAEKEMLEALKKED